MLRKREIYRGLKRGLIDQVAKRANRQSLVFAPPETWEHVRAEGSGEPEEVWSFCLISDSFSKAFDIQSSENGDSTSRSFLFEISPEQHEDLRRYGWPDPEVTAYRMFVIYLNADLFSERNDGWIDEEWLTHIERLLLAVAHEIHYIDQHETLRRIYPAAVYESINKSRYKNPVSQSDYNLLCSILTMAKIIDEIERQHGGATLFTTQADYDAWRSRDERARRGFSEMQLAARERFISLRRANVELDRIFDEYFSRSGGIPRGKDGRIAIEKVEQIEREMDENCHPGGMSEEESLEATDRAFAASATEVFAEARKKALESGCSVVEVHGDSIVRTRPDGTSEFIKKAAPFVVMPERELTLR